MLFYIISPVMSRKYFSFFEKSLKYAKLRDKIEIINYALYGGNYEFYKNAVVW